jgi:phage shock protein A
MFEDLQKLFRESLAAFRAELGKREPVDEVAELLSSMRRELVAAKANLPELDADTERVRLELARDRAELEQCERRGLLAEKIGDVETVNVARGWAERLRERVRVLEQKYAASIAERELRGREVVEMQTRYRTAETNRFQMVDALVRDRSRQRRDRLGQETGGSFDDFSRMEEKINGAATVDEILREMDAPESAPDRAEPALDVEERLRELKRRMGN